MKICTKCNIEKSLKDFYKKKATLDGHMSECKICCQLRNKEAYLKNKKSRRVYDQKYQLENKLKLQEYRKKYKEDNKEKLAKQNRIWRENNTDIRKELHKKWWEENKERINEWRRMNKYISNQQSAKRRATKRRATPWWSETEAIKELYKKALEMTVETGIHHHVDHIIPLTNPNVQGLHVLANLRVIPYYENLSKSNKLIEDIVLS